MAMEMNDDEIYAYEQEMNEMDEWEEMHAHEMEAAEEELRAMEAAERGSGAQSSKAPTAVATHAPPPAATSPVMGSQDVTMNLDGRFAATQGRLQSVLDRCAAALGESESEAMGDTEMIDDYVTRKEKATTMDASTSLFLMARPPIDSDSMPIVLPSGERRFLRKRFPTFEPRRPAAPNVAANALVPIGDLMEALEQRQIEAAVNADKRKHESVRPRPATSHAKDNTLWLDKYKPQRFVDLLSDEKTNREVLGWLKQWDPYVFPNKKAYQPTWNEFDNNNNNNSAGNSGSTYGKTWKNGNGFEKDEFQADANDVRPREKIILVCGPPGAGKTTLANIIARHAGYNPIEVNASDDRTSGVLKNKIISAMEMQSIWGDNKPNCIILDEIDGAMNGGDGKSAIAAIQEIVSAPLNHSKDKNGKKTGRQASNKHPLTRPLICICNDQYASVLRPLRKLAKIFVLDTPNSQRLVSRLKVICRDEGIKTTTGALAALCTNGANDVRYCVNALQFQSTQTKHLTAAALTSGLIGQKDHSRGVFETMDMVFFQSAKAKSKASAASSTALDQLDEACFALGNFPLLINALDENLPRMMFNDPTMSKLCDAFEWMGIADTWDTAVRAEQQFSLMAFIPFAARAVHVACCTSSRRRVEYPKTHADATKKLDKSRNILQAFVENSQMQPSVRHSADVLVVDVVPWLLATLSPNVRHLTANVQSAEEKAMVQRLIELMATLGLSFRPKFLPDGSEDYALEPALHEVVEFRDLDNVGQFVGRSAMMLPLAVRKMITREVELEQMRKSEASEQALASVKRSRASGTGNSTKSPSKPMVVDLAQAAQQFVLPELSAQQQAAKLEIMRKRNPFAFAHREAKRKRDADIKDQKQQQEQHDWDEANVDSNGDPSHQRKRGGMRYRFNEGYTSGIKTPVFMRDFL